MNEAVLTLHNPLLSEPKNAVSAASFCAINCTNRMLERCSDLSATAWLKTRSEPIASTSLPLNLGRNYSFQPFNGRRVSGDTPTLSVATLVRRIASISKAHEARNVSNPCRSEPGPSDDAR